MTLPPLRLHHNRLPLPLQPRSPGHWMAQLHGLAAPFGLQQRLPPWAHGTPTSKAGIYAERGCGLRLMDLQWTCRGNAPGAFLGSPSLAGPTRVTCHGRLASVAPARAAVSVCAQAQGCFAKRLRCAHVPCVS